MRILPVVLLAVAFTACRPKAPETPPAPIPPAPEAAAVPAVPESAAPQVVHEAVIPAADAATATSKEPELTAMSSAAPASSKMGVPVDLRYSFDGDVQPGRPVTLHLAAVPQSAGSNLSVSIKEDAGIQAVAAPMSAQKVEASRAYRQQLSVTRLADGPTDLRVLVTMDMPVGSGHSWFSVPLTPRVASGTPKGAPIKQR
jgi:hypothetical protein